MNKPVSPSVAICIPTYNQKEGYLRQCITSVLEQDYENITIIISVNGGDQTADLVLSQFNCSKIQIVRPDRHLEMAANFDFCFAYAKADYVSFLSSDDMMLPGCIQHLVQQMQQNPEASFCTGNLIRSEVLPISDGEQQKFALRDVKLQGYFSSQAAKNILFPWRMQSTWMTACLIKRDAISQDKIFENSPFLVWGDMWLTLVLLNQGGLVISAKITGFYRQRGSNEVTAYGNRMLFDYCDLLTCKKLGIAHDSFVANNELKRRVLKIIKNITPKFLILIAIFCKSSPTSEGLNIAMKNQSLNAVDRLVLKLFLLSKKSTFLN